MATFSFNIYGHGIQDGVYGLAKVQVRAITFFSRYVVMQ